VRGAKVELALAFRAKRRFEAVTNGVPAWAPSGGIERFHLGCNARSNGKLSVIAPSFHLQMNRVLDSKIVVMDPERTEAQAEALLATRRILARLKLELLEKGEELASDLTEEDRELLAHDTEWRTEDDLRVFAEWHAALGTDPEVALREMRERLRGGSKRR
jgi:hypothetical protein